MCKRRNLHAAGCSNCRHCCLLWLLRAAASLLNPRAQWWPTAVQDSKNKSGGMRVLCLFREARAGCTPDCLPVNAPSLQHQGTEAAQMHATRRQQHTGPSVHLLLLHSSRTWRVALLNGLVKGCLLG